MEVLIKKICEKKIDFSTDKNYIYFNELNEKNGERYNHIITNNLNLNNYSSHSPSCNSLYNVLEKLNIDKTCSILDIGSGRGFALLIFSLFNFNKISGVEICEDDYNICLENLNKLNLKDKIDIFNDNILSFKFFSKYNYFYFYNPFNSEIFEIVVKQLPEKSTVIYKNIHDLDIEVLKKFNFVLFCTISGEERDYLIFKNFI